MLWCDGSSDIIIRPIIQLAPPDEILLPDMNENQDADRKHKLNPTEEEAVV